MVKHENLLLIILFLLSGCAGTGGKVSHPDNYVEIDNPALTLSPQSPPTIWVPSDYVEKGVPRGGRIIDRGIESIRAGLTGSEARQSGAGAPSPAPSGILPVTPPRVTEPAPSGTLEPLPSKVVASSMVRNRFFLVEIGNNGLLPGFRESLRKTSDGKILQPVEAVSLTRNSGTDTPTGRTALSNKLQEVYGANLILFVSAPDGISGGKSLSAEIREGHGGTLVRRIEAIIPPYPDNDRQARTGSINAALRELSRGVSETAALIPWYGRVVAVDGERAYINAGKESGVARGASLAVYRKGGVVDKLGYSPGARAGTLEVTGYVGTDGAFGVMKENGKVRVSDLVGLE